MARNEKDKNTQNDEPSLTTKTNNEGARAEYGKQLIKEFSKQLSAEFGRGFMVANIWNFRQFYLIFQTDEKLYALRRELTWTHYRHAEVKLV